jgi:hypothetical protein
MSNYKLNFKFKNLFFYNPLKRNSVYFDFIQILILKSNNSNFTVPNQKFK